MSSDLFSFQFANDFSGGDQPSYNVIDAQYVSFPDVNMGSYPMNQINFNSMTLKGDAAYKVFDYQSGYVQIPFQCLLQSANATFDPTFSYTYALNHLGSHFFIENLTLQVDGTNVVKDVPCSSVWRHKQFESWSDEKMKIWGNGILQTAFDEGDSMTFSTTAGEVNNQTVAPTTLAQRANPATKLNPAMLKRAELQWRDGTQASRNTPSIFTGETLTLTSVQNQGQITFVDASNIVYSGVAIIPLALLHPFFNNLPSLVNCVFSLNLHLNIGNSNSWTVNYNPTTNAVTSVVSGQSVGNVCPFILAPTSADGSTGLKVTPVVGAAAYSLRITSNIGWNLNTIQGVTIPVGGSLGGGRPCAIVLPTIIYTPPLYKKILDNKDCTFFYRDIYVQRDSGRTGSNPIQVPITTAIARARKLWIIPTLASSPNQYPESLQSPLTSAGITSCPVRLKNLQVRMGGANCFQNWLVTNEEFFDQRFMSMNALVNGNCVSSLQFGSQITKGMFCSGAYGATCVNLQHSDCAESDVLQANFTLEYIIDAPNTGATYNMWYIIEFDGICTIDRATGQIAQSPGKL